MIIKSLGEYQLTIATEANFNKVCATIEEAPDFSIDTETTGLGPYSGDKLFSFAIFTGNEAFYFSFNDIPDNLGKLAPVILPRKLIKELKFLDKKEKELIAHNAKFDLHFLSTAGLAFDDCSLYDTQVAARLVNNQLPTYKLEALAALIGFSKDDTVKEYIKKNKLYRHVKTGKKEPTEVPRYDLVPFDIMAKYCAHDAYITYKLAEYTKKRVNDIALEQSSEGLASILEVLKTEQKVTRVLFEMEKEGITVDIDYARNAFLYQCEKYTQAEENIYRVSGVVFNDSPTCLKEIFTALKLVTVKTATGRDSFSKDVLPNHEIAEYIIDYRKAYKLAHTYYENFLLLADKNCKIHTDFRQSGTSTGRLSASTPNMQNVPKREDDTEDYKARGSFVPAEGTFFYMPDFDQMEYRLLLDIAEETGLIDKIKGGLDVHTATAEDMGVSRTDAKTLNFMLLYGGGPGKLAASLGISLAEAKRKKALYFRVLKNVSGLVSALTAKVEKRGHITNWYGRRLMLPPQGAYAIPNHYIQGGCADIVKVAMVELYEFLRNYKSKMILQVHDEILFQIVKGEEHILPELNRIMRDAYPYTHLPLTCGSDYSNTNWHEKKGIKCLENFTID